MTVLTFTSERQHFQPIPAWKISVQVLPGTPDLYFVRSINSILYTNLDFFPSPVFNTVVLSHKSRRVLALQQSRGLHSALLASPRFPFNLAFLCCRRLFLWGCSDLRLPGRPWHRSSSPGGGHLLFQTPSYPKFPTRELSRLRSCAVVKLTVFRLRDGRGERPLLRSNILLAFPGRWCDGAGKPLRRQERCLCVFSRAEDARKMPLGVNTRLL